jgi:Carboxypeptidase regulatory-like domain
MTVVKSRAIGVALVVLIAAIAIGCDGGTLVQGRVCDLAGNPMKDVQVTLRQGDRTRTVKTGQDGLYRVGMTHSPFKVNLSLTAEKGGYSNFEKRFYSTDHLRSLDITLKSTQ